MSFKDIRGHDGVISILKGTIKKGRLPNAYIFTGQDGIGKRLTALGLAKALNCQDISDDMDACGRCPSCKRIEKGVHPDTLIVEPEGGQILLEQVRAIEEFLSFKAYEGGMKVVVIDDAEKLNPSSANALLKTLEEPPAGSLLILISSIPDILPATVVSRCHRVNFSPLPADDVREILSRRFDNEKARLLSLLSEGRPGLVIDGVQMEERERFFNELRGIEGLELEPWKERDAMDMWFKNAYCLMRDIVVYKATGDEKLLINFDKIAYIKAMADRCGLHQFLDIANELDRITGLLRFNLNKSITLCYAGLLLKTGECVDS